MSDDDLIRRGDALAAAADLYRWSIAAGEELEAAIAALPAVTVGAPDVCAEALSDMARDDAPLIRAILPAMTPEVRELVREKDALRLQRAAMHRRAQRAEGKAHRSAHLLETILRSIKEALPMLPTLPSPYPLSLHSLYHRVRAARDHARASSGRALVENWHIWRRYYDEEKARAERLEALLREARSDLEAYITHEYPKDEHPYYERMWNLDMELCRRIDAALKGEEAAEARVDACRASEVNEHEWRMDAEAKLFAAEAALDAEKARNARLEEALLWCSGSADFNEGGVARKGWLKLCAPLLKGDKP